MTPIHVDVGVDDHVDADVNRARQYLDIGVNVDLYVSIIVDPNFDVDVSVDFDVDDNVDCSVGGNVDVGAGGTWRLNLRSGASDIAYSKLCASAQLNKLKEESLVVCLNVRVIIE